MSIGMRVANLGRWPAAEESRSLGLVGVAGLVLGVTAQLLRQIQGPLMALGAATAPWLTVGFFFAVWTTRRRTSLRAVRALGVATMAMYLVAWLLSYHTTFAIRESVALAAGWREAAPWLILAMPTCVVLGITAAAANNAGVLGDTCLALPIAWSMPEIVSNVGDGRSHALVVALPTIAAAISIVWVAQREVKLLRVTVAVLLFAMAGFSLVPVIRSFIHS